jgi:hypothetical protein
MYKRGAEIGPEVEVERSDGSAWEFEGSGKEAQPQQMSEMSGKPLEHSVRPPR